MLPDAQNATPQRVAFQCRSESLASQVAYADGGCFHRTYCKLARPVSRCFGGYSRRASAILWAVRNLSSSRYITGTLYIAIRAPFVRPILFKHLLLSRMAHCLNSGRKDPINLLKNVEQGLELALRTVVRPPSANQNPPNRRSAPAARQPRPQVYAVRKLEETTCPLGIHIIRHRRAAQLNRMLQDLFDSQPQPLQIRLGQPACHPPRPNPGPIQALICINVSHPCQQ